MGERAGHLEGEIAVASSARGASWASQASLLAVSPPCRFPFSLSESPFLLAFSNLGLWKE